jgi:3-hydroxyacyl-[acyl-carrier-protein] dehydratase
MMNILKRLHHRAPYLMIDEVVSHNKNALHAKKVVKLSEGFIQGHFPGAPIVPGAMMQEMTTQAAGLLLAEHYSPVEDYDSEKTKGYALGVLRAIHKAKYKHFARPNEELNIYVHLLDQLEQSFYFQAHIEVLGKKIMFNEFTLVNISDEWLLESAPLT